MYESRALRRALGLAAMIPPLVALAVIVRWSVDLPFWDEYDVPGRVIDLYVRGELGLADLYAQHNEARKVLPTLVWLGLVVLFDGWHVLPALAVTWSLALAIVLGSLGLLRGAGVAPGVRAWSALALTSLLFSLASWEFWVWGISSEAYYTPLLLLSAVALFARRRRGVMPWAWAAVACVGSSFSLANGLLSWPLLAAAGGVLGLGAWKAGGASRRHWTAGAALFGCTALLAVGFYFHDYHSPPHHPELSASLGDLPAIASFFLRWISAPLVLGMAPTDGRAEQVGAMALVGGLLVLGLALREARRMMPALPGPLVLGGVLMAYGGASGALTSVGRFEMGPDAWRPPHYVCFSVHCYVGAVVLLSWLASRWGEHPRRCRAIVAVQLLLVAVVTANSWSALRYVEAVRGEILRARSSVVLWLSGGPGHHLERVHPVFEEAQGARVRRLVEAGVFPVAGLGAGSFEREGADPVEPLPCEVELREGGEVAEILVTLAEGAGPGDVVLLHDPGSGDGGLLAWGFVEPVWSGGSQARLGMEPAVLRERSEAASLWHFGGEDMELRPLRPDR